MDTAAQVRQPWNKGLIVGQKRPLLPRQVWSIRVRLEMSGSPRDLALFNLAIDSKLRASDLDVIAKQVVQSLEWADAIDAGVGSDEVVAVGPVCGSLASLR
jgi:hypothetical protein